MLGPLGGTLPELYILAMGGGGVSGLIVDSGALVSCCTEAEWPNYKTEAAARAFNLRSVTGQQIQHFGVKRGVELRGTEGQVMRGDFQVTSCARSVLSVAERARAGNLVVLGPNIANIVTNPSAVASIQKQLPAAAGIDIENVGGQCVLTATEARADIA